MAPAVAMPAWARPAGLVFLGLAVVPFFTRLAGTDGSIHLTARAWAVRGRKG